MIDYSRIIADRIRAAIGDGLALDDVTLDPADVYDNADPNREWLGATTVEVDEIDVATTPYLDGRIRDRVAFVVLVRAQRRKSAVSLALWLSSNVVEPALSELAASGALDDYAIDGLAAAPDARNLSVGETFAARVSYTTHERKFSV